MRIENVPGENTSAERINCKFCTFGVQSEDEDELLNVIDRHNKEYHPDERVTREEVCSRIETVER